MGPSRKNISHTGTRTRVFRGLCIRKEVKAGYPNQLDYMGLICQFPFNKFNENSSRGCFVFAWWFLAGGLLLVCAVPWLCFTWTRVCLVWLAQYFPFSSCCEKNLHFHTKQNPRSHPTNQPLRKRTREIRTDNTRLRQLPPLSLFHCCSCRRQL